MIVTISVTKFSPFNLFFSISLVVKERGFFSTSNIIGLFGLFLIVAINSPTAVSDPTISWGDRERVRERKRERKRESGGERKRESGGKKEREREKERKKFVRVISYSINSSNSKSKPIPNVPNYVYYLVVYFSNNIVDFNSSFLSR
jgi:hypothetical protein